MNRLLKCGRGGQGFTLIEILMAAAASTLILAAIYGVFGRAMHLRDAAMERMRSSRVQVRAANAIRNDLRNALVSGGTLASSLLGAREAPSSRFPGYLRFTTTTAQDHSEVDPSGDVQEVEYFIANDPETIGRNAGVLVRTVDRNLLASTREASREERLLKDVSSLEVSFYDGQSWTDAWEITDEDKTLPQAVRVRVARAATDPQNQAATLIEVLVPWTTQSSISTESATTATSSATGSPSGNGDPSTPEPPESNLPEEEP